MVHEPKRMVTPCQVFLKKEKFNPNCLIACITPVILFIWDLIQSVNISGHVALLLFVGLVSETARLVSPHCFTKYWIFLCTHFVRPRKVIQGQEIDNTHVFQNNWVSACCNILLYFLLWFMSDLFCNWTGGKATSCLTIWFMNQFMPKEYELGIPGEFPHRCESLFST